MSATNRYQDRSLRGRLALPGQAAGGIALLFVMARPAQAADDPEAPTAIETPSGAETPTATDARRAADASVDRNLLLPTAETLPKGTLAFNSYELFLAGVSYGVTDRLQISGTTLLPITSDVPFLVLGSVKYNVYRAPRLLFSLMGNGSAGQTQGVKFGTFGASAIVDGMLDSSGRFVLTGGAMTQFVFGGAHGNTQLADAALLVFWTGISARAGEHVKFKAEVILPGGYSWAGSNHFEIVQDALLATYGVRFFSRTLAVDLSFIRPLSPNVDTGKLIMGIPFVAFTAAF